MSEKQKRKSNKVKNGILNINYVIWKIIQIT